jgi:SAM-dependent methyltransferase
MTETIKIPDAAVPFILFQRTAYIRLIHSLPYRALNKLSPGAFYKLAVFLESKLRNQGIKAQYDADMQQEYLSLKDALPQSCHSMLDIGCGIAGIDVLLGRHYGPGVDIYLLDKSKVEDEVFYLFNNRGAFYNSLETATETLVGNGIPAQKIHALEANAENTIPEDAKFDLIFSLISWGFHYPVSTYLDQVYTRLAEGGSLIVDVRRGTGGFEEIQARFGNARRLQETATRVRLVALKNS